MKMMRISHPEFGPWIVDLRWMEIVCGEGEGAYGVNLEDCDTSAQVLDWIIQVHVKSWATPEVIAGLLEALYATLDPQATLCSFGVSKKLAVTRAGVRARLIRYLAASDAMSELEGEGTALRIFDVAEWHEQEKRHAERWDALIGKR